MTREEELEIDQVVSKAVETAYKEYPPLLLTPLVKILIALFAVLLLVTSGDSTYNTVHLASIQKCQATNTANQRTVAQQDRAVVDQLENTKSQLIAKRVPVTDPQWKAAIDKYNRDRAANDKQRLAISKKCS